ncbi:two-component system response regulator [Leptospira congkakensis]|uniref:Two-component system response regulator n=1 Tax=Leptospira congkakensis TaxID=2484932 RepID=A0A4Z1AM24_9LEPT|nr:two-component system response regulator [Leptospira congkakensis]TGL90668.1 two-component system response regulator [Leptospira congkakensis]TGL91675.1 two-component system response regulator [Leptospira congkakensis]TGL98727.1 two-component system response regulator [Leptospira congkakensis]
MEINSKPKILIVDDEPTNLQILNEILQNDYTLLFAKDGLKGIELAESQEPELILLDVMMPEMTGHEVCKILKSNEKTKFIPVIFVTALTDVGDEEKGFQLGAVDYITKPVSPPIVKVRIKNHLSLVDVNEVKTTRLQIVQRLGMASEYKDNETGMHVIRMSHYSQSLALAYGYSSEAAEEILNAAPMHDVGKIGIPDHIIQKPGKLTPEEWEIMKRHPEIGAEIIGDHNSSLLKLARSIAITHHEKYDGTGYPYGLKGDKIPLEGRIIAIADVFDALTTVRPYKKAWEVDAAIEFLKKESGTHFDPNLVQKFVSVLPTILEIKNQWPEET